MVLDCCWILNYSVGLRFIFSAGFLPITGGNVTGNIILNGGADSSLKITNNSSLLQLLGGYDNGATLHMFGSEYSDEIAGAWVFYAIKDLNKNEYSYLALHPDGTLTLNVKGTAMNFGLSGIINDSTTGQNGYILFGNKICFQWLAVLTGEFNNGVNYKEFTLPISIQWSFGGYYNDFGGNQFTVGVWVSSTNANLRRGTGDTESHAGNIFVVSKI